jgi:hypothetical protein
MKREDVQKLDHGVYRIFWKKSEGGGSSVAAVGSKCNGDRWMCPSNWTSDMDRGTDSCSRSAWKAVERVELIEKQYRPCV